MKFSADYKLANEKIKSIYIGDFKSFNDAVKAAKKEPIQPGDQLVGVRLRINGEFAPYLKD